MTKAITLGVVELTPEAIEAIAAAVAAKVAGADPKAGSSDKGSASDKGGKSEKSGSSRGRGGKSSAKEEAEKPTLDKATFEKFLDDAEEALGEELFAEILGELDYKVDDEIDEADYAKLVDELLKAAKDEKADLAAPGEEKSGKGSGGRGKGGKGGKDDEPAKAPEITPETAKAMYEKAKKADEKEVEDVMEEFGITSVRGIAKLSAEDLADFYEEMAEIAGA